MSTIEPVPAVPPTEPPAASSSWPSRVVGYWKLILGAIGTVGVGGVLAWLHDAGVTTLPGWANAGITAFVTLTVLLFGPKNKA